MRQTKEAQKQAYSGNLYGLCFSSLSAFLCSLFGKLLRRQRCIFLLYGQHNTKLHLAKKTELSSTFCYPLWSFGLARFSRNKCSVLKNGFISMEELQSQWNNRGPKGRGKRAFKFLFFVSSFFYAYLCNQSKLSESFFPVLKASKSENRGNRC